MKSKAEMLRAWLISRLCQTLRIQPDRVDTRAPLTDYGLKSVDLIGLSGDLEEWLGRELSPTLLYDHPTIESLVAYLTPDSDLTVSTPKVNRRHPSAELIAIIGIGCRFPAARNPQSFWRLLCDATDAITEVPANRWDAASVYDCDRRAPGKMNTRWGGFLDEVDQFDYDFFGISPREAARMDPQQRLLLEVAWEALEDAGQIAERLAGSRTSVFVGVSSSDYARMQMNDVSRINAYSGTGGALSITANRLSYYFDLRGPSMAIDAACASSLVAVHLACRSLRSGESDLALAAGVNLITFSKVGTTAPDGRCKAFDARADGYARSEGAGTLVLKPLSKALADGDRIYAVIRGSAVNQDGRSNGLMAPNGVSQEAVLREAYREAGISP
ncbi:MAG: beta-ketoacyl synthase, partial [Acidobacteria bacterium]